MFEIFLLIKKNKCYRSLLVLGRQFIKLSQLSFENTWFKNILVHF